MPIYRVFHYTGSKFSDQSFAEWPGPAYVEVAAVEAPALGAVFQLTNHLDAPWTDNPEVTLPRADAAKLAEARATNPDVNSSVVLQRRSTMVGDVVVDTDGYAYGVKGAGWDATLGYVSTRLKVRIEHLRVDFKLALLSSSDLYNRVAALLDWKSDFDTHFVTGGPVEGKVSAR